MMWKKLAIAVQKASFALAVAGMILAVLAIKKDEIIPGISIEMVFIGYVVGMAALLWEEYLSWLHFERSKRNTCRQKKSAQGRQSNKRSKK